MSLRDFTLHLPPTHAMLHAKEASGSPLTFYGWEYEAQGETLILPSPCSQGSMAELDW